MADATASAAGTFRLEVITPERVLVDVAARSLQAAAEDGQVGILAHHAPYVAPLVPGLLRYQTAGGEKKLLVTGDGFLEVGGNRARALVDFAERPEDIDLKRAEEAKRRAEARLAERRVGAKADLDFARAEAALRRALIRLRAKDAT